MVRAIFVFAAVCVALASSADEQTEKSKQLLQRCLSESGATAENLIAFANGQPYPDGVKCTLKCFMQGNRAMREDGTIDVDAIVRFAGEDKRATSTMCNALATSADLCERAHQYESCFLAHEPEYFKATVQRVTS